MWADEPLPRVFHPRRNLESYSYKQIPSTTLVYQAYALWHKKMIIAA